MRAWLYYRLSRDEDEEMNSLQNQRQILVDYADSKIISTLPTTSLLSDLGILSVFK